MAFKEFTQYTVADRKQVTIRLNGFLFISSSLLNIFNPKYFNFVEIYIDQEALDIGIKFVEAQPETSYRNIKFEKSGMIIDVSHVLRYLGFDYLKNKFNSNVRNIDGMLVFSVKYIKKRR